jgi:sulfite dehydrogenase (cytochrome) subunit B
MKAIFFATVITLLGNAAAHADEQPVLLKNAPGYDAAENNCAACHSLDYIRTNAPFMDHKMWQAEVDKMINIYGAPIEANDAKLIIDYLAKNYGTGS